MARLAHCTNIKTTLCPIVMSANTEFNVRHLFDSDEQQQLGSSVK